MRELRKGKKGRNVEKREIEMSRKIVLCYLPLTAFNCFCVNGCRPMKNDIFISAERRKTLKDGMNI